MHVAYNTYIFRQGKMRKCKLTINRDYVKELLNIISKESKYWKSTLEIKPSSVLQIYLIYF
jgi:hypothetical protein